MTRTEQFAGLVVGHVVAELDDLRRTGRSQPVPDPPLELVGTHADPGFGHHRGADRLAPLGVGNADHDRLGHGRVAEKDLLDLPGRQVFAAADDDVIESPIEKQVAVVVEPTGVVGGKPAIGGEKAPSQVFAGDLLAADPDLAPEAGVDR